MATTTRRACAKWREGNPEPEPLGLQPIKRIDWPAAKAVVGLPIAVLVEEAFYVDVQRSRDAIASGKEPDGAQFADLGILVHRPQPYPHFYPPSPTPNPKQGTYEH